MTVVEETCGAIGWFYGGWALGLMADAAQSAAGQPVQDLSVAFLRPVALDRRLRVRCSLLGAGRALRYYRVDAYDGEGLALAATAVTGPPLNGTGEVDLAGDFEHAGRAPTVASPDECPPRPYFGAESNPHQAAPGISVLLDVRTAGDRLDAGLDSTMRLWARLALDLSDAVRLAVFSDHVPYLVRRALPEVTRVSTVTSSLRVTGGPVTEWVLMDMSLSARAGRTVAGRMNLWSSAGRLVAVAEQSIRLSYS